MNIGRFRQPFSCGWNLKHSEFNRAEIQHWKQTWPELEWKYIVVRAWSPLWSLIDCRGSISDQWWLVGFESNQRNSPVILKTLDSSLSPGGKWTWSLCSRCRRAAKVGNAGRSSGILKIDWNCTQLSKTNSLPLLDQQACCVRPGGNNGYTSHDWCTSHDWWCGAEWRHCNVAHPGGLAPVVVWWKDCSWDLPLIYKS